MLEVKGPADTEDYLPPEVQLLKWNSYILFTVYTVQCFQIQ
jgi:hypothetical protein